MDKAFSPADIESRIYAHWEVARIFRAERHGPAYSIVIPPPNVTGTLHMGHAFQDTIMDALIRYRAHARLRHACGSRASITPVSPRRWWSSGS